MNRLTIGLIRHGAREANAGLQTSNKKQSQQLLEPSLNQGQVGIFRNQLISAQGFPRDLGRPKNLYRQ